MKDSVLSEYIRIQWQEGFMPEVGVNGVQVEDVVDVIIARLQ